MDLQKYLNDIKSNPQRKRKATEPQIKFATKIADRLGLDYPNFDDFFETAQFINDNLKEFNDMLDYGGEEFW